MEVLTAVRRYLLSDATITGYAQQKVFRHRLEEKIEGTSGVAYVVSLAPGWATPDPVQSNEYPVVWIDCYADPSRNSAGDITKLDAEDKALAAARPVKALMHMKRGVRWGASGSELGLMIVSSSQWQYPEIIRAGDMHKAEPKLGDTVLVRTKWALNVATG